MEEDIKILEEFKTNGYHILLMKYGDRIKTNFKLEKAIEHIISDYKRTLKENEEWDRKFCNLQNLYFKLQDESESERKEWQEAYKSEKKMKNEYVKLYQDILLKENVIPVQKVKEKIEELNKRIDFLNTELTKCYIEREKLGTETDIDNNETYIFYMEEEKNFREKQKEVLQELLGEE